MFTGVSAVIDLYGQCAQVSITSVSGILPTDNNAINRAVAEHTNFNSPVSTAGMYEQYCSQLYTACLLLSIGLLKVERMVIPIK